MLNFKYEIFKINIFQLFEVSLYVKYDYLLSYFISEFRNF